MTAHEILERYEHGESSADLILNILSQESTHEVEEALGKLPPTALRDLGRFIRDYGPDIRVVRGPDDLVLVVGPFVCIQSFEKKREAAQDEHGLG